MVVGALQQSLIFLAYCLQQCGGFSESENSPSVAQRPLCLPPGTLVGIITTTARPGSLKLATN
ncbi:hypothetical protein Plhal710r2_c087g0182521 [Plasmopara halstedii]